MALFCEQKVTFNVVKGKLKMPTKKPPVKSEPEKQEKQEPQAPSLFATAQDQAVDLDVKNEAKLTDVWAPLRFALVGQAVPSADFLFKGSDIAVDKSVAFYKHTPTGTYIAIDTEGGFYDVAAIESNEYNTITREEAFRGILPEAKPELESAEQESPPPSTTEKETPEPDIVDAEFRSLPLESAPQPESQIEPDHGLSTDQKMALRSPMFAGNIDRLSMIPDRALEILKTRVQIVRNLRIASIQATFATDWVKFINKDTGQEIAYLQDCGCERVIKLWNIESIDKIPPTETRIVDPQNPNIFQWIFNGNARSTMTGEEVYGIEGTRYSDDPFFKNFSGLRLDYKTKQAARTNFDGNVLRTLSGLGNVPIEELTACGLDVERCHKGRGYDRTPAGADVTIKDAGIPASQFPKCDKCGGEMKFIPGRNDEQKQYEAFFACKKPKGECDGKTVKAAGWIAKVKQAQPKIEAESPTTETGNSSGWKCGKAKQGTIENMRKLLVEKHKQTPQQLYANLYELFPEDGITPESLGDERAASYIGHLAKWINSFAG